MYYNFLLFVLASAGLTQIIVESFFVEYFLKQRFKKMAAAEDASETLKKRVGLFLKLVNCYQCAGYWVGIVCGLITFPFLNHFDWTISYILANLIFVPAFIYGPIGSLSAVVGAAILNLLDNMVPFTAKTSPQPAKEEQASSESSKSENE